MATPSVVTFLFLLFAYSILHSAYCEDEKDDKVISNMKRLKDKLFQGYDKTVRPESHHNHTTALFFNILPRYIICLDEEQSLFSIDSWFVLYWKDKRLRWNASLYEGLEHLILDDHEIWQPDLRIYNGHSSSIDPMKSASVHVHPDGFIWWIPPALVSTFCDVTTPVGKYPYDTHVCNITVGSWSHNGWQINITVRHDRPMYWGYFSNTHPRWEIDTEESKMFRVVRKYDCCEEPYISVNSRFILNRRPPAQIQVVRVPCILVMVLTLTMFWIPSDSGKKILLGGSLFIVLTALTIYCAAFTRSPRTPLLSVSFVQATMIAVSVAVILEVVVINLGSMRGPRKPPEYLLTLLAGTVGTYMGICAPWMHSVPGDKVRLQEEDEHENADPTPKQQWLVVATGCDRILFVAFVVVFAAIHQV